MNNVVLSELDRKILVAIVGDSLQTLLKNFDYPDGDIRNTCFKIGAGKEFEAALKSIQGMGMS